MSSYHHFIARARHGLQSFVRRDACVDFWNRLRESFPQILALTLMPEHLHLLLETVVPGEAKRVLGAQLSGFARRFFRGKELWEPIPPPVRIPDLHHLKRQIRYTHLNPCRRGLVRDPLGWEWSTHREAVGAAASDWLDRRTLMRAFDCSTAAVFKARFHRYVSSDPSVRIEGTPLPNARPLKELIVPVPALREAVLQASRADAGAASTRRPLILLADQLGLHNTSAIAEVTGLAPRTVRHLRGQPPSDQDRRVVTSAGLLLSAPGQFGLG
jgi:hypothetical protein